MPSAQRAGATQSLTGGRVRDGRRGRRSGQRLERLLEGGPLARRQKTCSVGARHQVAGKREKLTARDRIGLGERRERRPLELALDRKRRIDHRQAGGRRGGTDHQLPRPRQGDAESVAPRERRQPFEVREQRSQVGALGVAGEQPADLLERVLRPSVELLELGEQGPGAVQQVGVDAAALGVGDPGADPVEVGRAGCGVDGDPDRLEGSVALRDRLRSTPDPGGAVGTAVVGQIADRFAGEQVVAVEPVGLRQDAEQELAPGRLLVLDLDPPAVGAGAPQHPAVVDRHQVAFHQQLAQPQVASIRVPELVPGGRGEDRADRPPERGEALAFGAVLRVLAAPAVLTARVRRRRQHGTVGAVPANPRVGPALQALHSRHDGLGFREDIGGRRRQGGRGGAGRAVQEDAEEDDRTREHARCHWPVH